MKQSNMLLSQKEDLNENVLSHSNKFSKGTQFGRTPYSGLNGCKTQVNGFYTNKPPTGLHRPRANSATSRNFPSKASAMDNKPFSNVRRSQSFSHSVQNSLLSGAPLTRSYSFNREVDPSRPYQSQHIPMQTTFRPNAATRTVKQYGLTNGNNPQMKSSFTRTYPLGSSLGVKKSGLSNVPTVTVPLGYRMNRPSLQKTNRFHLTRENICNDNKGAPATTEIDKIVPNNSCQATRTPSEDLAEELDVDNCSSSENLDKENCKDSYYSEDVDEFSISSLSSSDKNDLSEDFSDDFIDLEDGNKTIIESEDKVTEKPSEELLAELENKKPVDMSHSDEWIDVNISGKVENMSHFERTERSLRQQQKAFWKRTPPRLNGQEQYHLSNPDHYHNGSVSSYLESPTDHRESYGSPNYFPQSPRSSQMMGLRESTVMLDEMTLCHMVQDCTTVKTQLLKLKRLLQQEDDLESQFQEVQQSVPTTPEPQDTATVLKTEDLLREIEKLKEESKKKDETIKHLQQQLKTPCKCQKNGQDSKMVKPKQQDKYTQTPWRRSSSGYSAPSFSPWQGPYQGGPRTGPPHRRQRVEELVHYFSDTACIKYYSVPSALPILQTTPREN
ncbi:hypothetical protein GDO81_004324 [Engystomops pustulosus]|uniref:Coiled-coil serine rich protein 2 n=1 Tax=Engystomops pustulosus TaxID=76066 RepID=A0AAV6ZWM6_ENGPU|nr:hypothetical protein GDO81_004324 [Engystomops pustulosus]